MRTDLFRTPRRRGDLAPVPEKQIARWLDDGGAPRVEWRGEPAPVTWSPVALNARLDAQRALEALPRRSTGVAARARSTLGRIVSQVNRREIEQHSAIAELRELTARLSEHRAVEQSQRGPRDWQLLHARASGLGAPVRHRVLVTAISGATAPGV
ncbi:hypothetical protein [Microbacterium sp. BK668]|uniref:hypothetical protein n=1 Tax=Microbacterium sp. BK668 TaxID=2512118 RepID=UPI001060DCAE|nr:hypothetical protein [Microbacterium sp. BK668]TDN91384.1 hypothetical protein EV279_0883 [Microbacterium sp. BK668]